MDMNLFYLKGRPECPDYSKVTQEGFMHYRIGAGKNYENESRKDCIFFLIEGKVMLKNRGKTVGPENRGYDFCAQTYMV